jgi:hypothetical protein
MRRLGIGLVGIYPNSLKRKIEILNSLRLCVLFASLPEIRFAVTAPAFLCLCEKPDSRPPRRHPARVASEDRTISDAFRGETTRPILWLPP